MRRLRYRLYIHWLALRWMFQFNLGDQVWHLGKRRTIINWAGHPTMTLSDPYEQNVPREECRKVWSVPNLWHSYRAGVRFYTGSWLGIWERDGIEPWVRALDIWPGKHRE
ncbi:MAG TPA: hypothetical protein VFS24_07450 [Steroidobacteraceae bacterium]|nr:hypothetical protein [Steroidobacteraceae bacterium]